MTEDAETPKPSTAENVRHGYNKLLEGKSNVDRFGSQVTHTVNDVSNAYITVSRLFAQCRDIWRAISGKK